MSEQSATRELAEFIAGTQFQDIPEQQLREAERAIIDSLSATALGLHEPSSTAYHALLPDADRENGISVIDRKAAASTVEAVGYHAALSHQVELAPAVSRAVLHLNGIILAALGLAEELGSPGKELLRAVVLGCEVAIRFGRALNTDPSWTEEGDHPVAFLKGWWTPALGSTIGIATAAVTLRNGTADELHNAWGLAVNFTPASSVQVVLDGSTGKGATMSQATNGGLTAATLALSGATGLEDIVGGWFPLVVDAFDPAMLTHDLPGYFEFNFLLYKPYATVGPCFAPIEAALAARHQYPDLDVAQIRDIEVFGYTRTLTFFGPVPPPTAEGARGNLAYCIAAALVHNDPGEFILDAFMDEALVDETVLAVSQTVRTTFEAKYEAEYPLRSAKTRILVTLTNGQVLEGFANRSEMAKYHDPSNDEIDRKFNRALVNVPEADRQRVLTAVRGLATSGEAVAPMRLLSQAWQAGVPLAH